MARYRIITIIAILLAIYCISSALVKYTTFFANTSLTDVAATIGITGIILKLLTLYLYYAFESATVTKCIRGVGIYIKKLITRYKLMLSVVFFFLAIYFITAEGSKFIMLPHHLAGIILTISILIMYIGLVGIFFHWSFKSNKFSFIVGIIGAALAIYTLKGNIYSVTEIFFTKHDLRLLGDSVFIIVTLIIALLGYLLFALLAVLILSIYIIIIVLIHIHCGHIKYDIASYELMKIEFKRYFEQQTTKHH